MTVRLEGGGVFEREVWVMGSLDAQLVTERWLDPKDPKLAVKDSGMGRGGRGALDVVHLRCPKLRYPSNAFEYKNAISDLDQLHYY